MTDLDEFLAAPPPARTSFKGCAVTRFLDGLDTDRRAKLQSMLDDPNFTHRYLTDGLLKAGCKTTTSTVRNHRIGSCCQTGRDTTK